MNFWDYQGRYVLCFQFAIFWTIFPHYCGVKRVLSRGHKQIHRWDVCWGCMHNAPENCHNVQIYIGRMVQRLLGTIFYSLEGYQIDDVGRMSDTFWWFNDKILFPNLLNKCQLKSGDESSDVFWHPNWWIKDSSH